jgi:hypothetical protein
MDSQLKTSKKIYEFQLEMIYWADYVRELNNYISKTKGLSKKQINGINKEIKEVGFYINVKRRKIEEWLKKYNYSQENRLKIKKFHNEAKQSID